MIKRNLLELIWFRAYSDLKAEVNKTYIGVLWWILDPLLQMAIFYLVFGAGLRGTDRHDNFVEFLLIGIIMWRGFQSSVALAGGAILQNRALMLRVRIEKWVFPAALIASNTFKFFIALAVLIVYLIYAGMPFGLAYLQLPVLLVVLLTLTCGVSFVAAAIVPLVPDLKNVISHLLMLMFFLSGIFYAVSDMPADIQWVFLLNPMVHIIEGARAIMMQNASPDWLALSVIFGIGLFLMAIGSWLMSSLNTVYAKTAQVA